MWKNRASAEAAEHAASVVATADERQWLDRNVLDVRLYEWARARRAAEAWVYPYKALWLQSALPH